MIFEHESYRTYLKGVLVERIARNRAYSLRAMARQLSLAPSSLSEVLKGKINLSPETAWTTATRLGLDEKGREYFCLMVQLESAKSVELRAEIEGKLRQLNPQVSRYDVEVDIFKMISDWYHVPILMMTDLAEGFEPGSYAAWAARKLGISQPEAEAAIDRLVRLELLKRDDAGHLRRTKENLVARSGVPNEGLRRFHRQMLHKATESLETQTPQEKFVGSQTFAIDVTELRKFERRLDQVLTEMSQLARKGKKKTHVYHLGIQLFNLTDKGTDL